MKSSVDHQEHLSARDLFVQDATYINPGFADEIATPVTNSIQSRGEHTPVLFPFAVIEIVTPDPESTSNCTLVPSVAVAVRLPAVGAELAVHVRLGTALIVTSSPVLGILRIPPEMVRLLGIPSGALVRLALNPLVRLKVALPFPGVMMSIDEPVIKGL